MHTEMQFENLPQVIEFFEKLCGACLLYLSFLDLTKLHLPIYTGIEMSPLILSLCFCGDLRPIAALLSLLCHHHYYNFIVNQAQHLDILEMKKKMLLHHVI